MVIPKFDYKLFVAEAKSPVGKISGAHINPVASLAFWLRGKMNTSTMMGYIIVQMIRVVIGCLLQFKVGYTLWRCPAENVNEIAKEFDK